MKNSTPSLKKITTLFIFIFSLVLLTSCSDDPVDLDSDNDGISGTLDNCISVSNRDQADNDGDRIGDPCDDDDDNDGILDINDSCPLVANSEQIDLDNDGIGDACDDDIVISCSPRNPINPCVNGMAGIYPCDGYDLMAHLSMESLVGSGAEGNDSWGWTDTTTGKEYVIFGSTVGTTFVDICDTENLIVLGTLPSANPASGGNLWRDIKVYKDHAFIVSEASGHGMQVFDLTRLRTTITGQTFTADAHYTGFGSAHNIVINETSGYAYPVGTSRSGTYNGGPLFINIQNPVNPIDEGGFSDGGYSHDAQVVTYNGPDTDYAGKEILVGSNENEVVIANISDKNNPISISTVSYSNIGYTHQGWFTEDQRYFIVGDETDELNGLVSNTRILIFDLLDLDNPVLLNTYNGPTEAIDHNGYVNGNTFYLANYRAGVRMHDISNIATGAMTETGYFDTFPSSDGAAFNGAWNVYPFFTSGNIVVSDIEKGLFIIKKK